jgi:bifunctional non-homologous end joining protein LigD
MVIDLDPSSKNKFEEVIETAQAVKTVFEKAGANCFCKTSGATGLHIYVPLGAKYSYAHVRKFAQLIAEKTHELLPNLTSMERSLAKRGADKIYLDHLQNSKGQTLCSVYSIRPRAGATVSTPLDWREVKKGLSPMDFTIMNIAKRIEKKGDLFTPVLGKGIDMHRCLKNLGA